MKNKNNSTIHIVLVSLLISMVINYYVSLLYKDALLIKIGEQIYYQLITWISLAQPVFISLIYFYLRKKYFKLKKYIFLRKKIDESILPEETKEKLDALKKDAVSIKNTIDEIYEEQ